MIAKEELNILWSLEQTAEKYEDRVAVSDVNQELTWKGLVKKAQVIGAELSKKVQPGNPIPVLLEKSSETLAVMLGIVYAGCFYVPVNPMNPAERLRKIMEKLEPEVIISDEKGKEQLAAVGVGLEEKVIGPEILLPTTGTDLSEEQRSRLEQIQGQWKETDALYGIFTSGSTGTPKAIVVSHGAVSRFVRHFTEIFEITSADVIGNQAPFDFDVSVKDIYSVVKTGATLVVVPRRMFSAPAELIDFICDRRVTVMIWAVSALCLISTFHALDYRTPETVNKILFSGEVMPLKALKNFRSHLPNAKYVNLYGPTEITCNCTYHILDNERDYADGIPIGKPFPNEDVILLDENNSRISEVGKVGEICVRGTALALGYYSNPEQNAKAFVQNPLNPHYPELIYRTGDLARYNENGELVFSGRKDFQIKYMGHRIELEEIEREMSAVDGVEQCCCIFDEKKSRLKGFYVGSIEKDELAASMSRDLPAFMIPGVIRKVDEMPLTKNGKIDRKKLAEIAGGRRK